MSFVIIGVALSAISVVGAAFAPRDRRARIATAVAGVAGILLIVLSRPSTEPFLRQSEAIRRMCRFTAFDLEAFELERLNGVPPWTEERAELTWNGISRMLKRSAELCIPDVSSCDLRLMTHPRRSQFTVELSELVIAFRTGEPCTR